jgi:hypothetical protein
VSSQVKTLHKVYVLRVIVNIFVLDGTAKYNATEEFQAGRAAERAAFLRLVAAATAAMVDISDNPNEPKNAQISDRL